MATKITEECINCGACEPECPNTAIYEGGVEWESASGGTARRWRKTSTTSSPRSAPSASASSTKSNAQRYVPSTAAFPIPIDRRRKPLLLERAKNLHPDTEIPDPPPSRFRT